MARVYLTNESVEALRAKAAKVGKPVVFTDDRLKGFLLKVSGDTATFYVQRDVGGQSVRVALGRDGATKRDDKDKVRRMTATDFRHLAEKVRAELGDANTAHATDPAQAAKIVAQVRARLEKAGAPLRDTSRFVVAPTPQAAGPQADAPAPARPPKWQRLTLRAAMRIKVADMRREGASERSIESLETRIRTGLGHWMRRPLHTITLGDIQAWRSRYLSDNAEAKRRAAEAARGIEREYANPAGMHTARGTLRNLSSVWNFARAQDAFAGLPAYPVVKGAIRQRLEDHKGEPIAWPDLPRWWKTAQAVSNPIRRDLLLFILTTGLRKTDAGSLRWEHVNIDDEPRALGSITLEPGSMHRPNPKGGKRKRFTVPLSDFTLELLHRRRRDNARDFGDGGGFVFPSRNRAGEVVGIEDPNQDDYRRDADGNIVYVEVPGKVGRRGKPLRKPLKCGHPILKSAHRLRETYATAGEEEGVPWIALKVLMNHTKPEGDVTVGYVKPTVSYLRPHQQRITDFLLERAGVRRGRPSRAEPAPLRLTGA